MGWVTLSLRKQTLRAEINASQMQSLQLSREKRQLQRHLSYEKSIFDHQKQDKLNAAKAQYKIDDLRKERSDFNPKDEGYSTEYADWQSRYSIAQDAYGAQKQQIEDYYDDIAQELEEEANEREQRIQEQLDELEVQRQDMQAEFDAIKDQIKTEIQNSAISF